MSLFTQYPSHNCGNCGHSTPCDCDIPLEEVDIVCPDPEPCEETFPMECVEYVGTEDIECEDVPDLHPALAELYYLVKHDGTRDERKLINILKQINGQLCYLFSKEHISRLLTIIKEDADLSVLFCELVCACTCDGCNIICQQMISVDMLKDDNNDNYLSVSHFHVIGAISYSYNVYEQDITDPTLYTHLYTVSTPYTGSDPVVIDLNPPIGVTLSTAKNYIVTYQASGNEPGCTVGIPLMETYTYTDGDTLPCGGILWEANPECDLECFSDASMIVNTDGSGNPVSIDFVFTPQTSAVGPITYDVHWYEELTPGTYTQAGLQTLVGVTTLQTIPLTGLTTNLPNNVIVLVKATVAGATPDCEIGTDPETDIDTTTIEALTCNKYQFTVPYTPCREILTFTATFLS